MRATDLEARIERIVRDFSGRLGYAAKNLDTGEALGFQAEEVFPTASAIKVAILAELVRRAGADLDSLGERVELRTEDMARGTGVLREMSPGLRPTLLDLARLMIVVSDNTATNMLIDRIGLEHINRSIQDWGLRSTRLLNRVDFEVIRSDIRKLAVSTPADLARLMELIATHRILDAAGCDFIIEIMRRQQYLDQIPRYLPYNPRAADLGLDQDMWIANKIGTFPGVRVDIGIVSFRALTYVLAVTTEGSMDLLYGAENEGAVAVGRVSRVIFEHWSEGH